MKKTRITDQTTIGALCFMQQQFVSAWNIAELDSSIEQIHELPGEAQYSAFNPNTGRYFKGVTIFLSDETFVVIRADASWDHFYPGWSFCRNPLDIAQVRDVTVHGSMASFEQWLQAALLELA